MDIHSRNIIWVSIRKTWPILPEPRAAYIVKFNRVNTSGRSFENAEVKRFLGVRIYEVVQYKLTAFVDFLLGKYLGNLVH